MPLADAGFRVIAPDYRAAWGSYKPPIEFTKNTIAAKRSIDRR